MFILFLIITLFVIVYPIRPVWVGWILSGIGGYLTGWFWSGWKNGKLKSK
jgi:hypothetical protein